MCTLRPFLLKNLQISKRMMSTATQSMQSTVIIEHIGPVTTFGLNRPERRNCVNVDTCNALKSAIREFENDANALVGVLYGVGGNFCAGYDLKELSELESIESLSTADTESGFMGPTHRFIKKPLIAAVSGYAVAGGLELALMCDMRVVEETAIMGVYCRRFGVPLLDGGTVRLTAMVGLSRALDLILTGRSLSAKEAFEYGIANRIVACGTALGQAVNLAMSLTKFPQKCLLADRKSAYNAAFTSSLVKLLEYERDEGQSIVQEESVDGAKKFVSGIGRHGTSYNLTEKKLPDWEQKSKL